MKLMQCLWLISLFLFNNYAVADSGLVLGDVAVNAMGPLMMLSGFMAMACLFVAICCLFAALVKYFAHRRNPLAVPLGKVIWLIIVAMMLLLMPISYWLTGHGDTLLAFLSQ